MVRNVKVGHSGGGVNETSVAARRELRGDETQQIEVVVHAYERHAQKHSSFFGFFVFGHYLRYFFCYFVVVVVLVLHASGVRRQG